MVWILWIILARAAGTTSGLFFGHRQFKNDFVIVFSNEA